MKVLEIIVLMVTMASAVGCSGEDKTDVDKTDAVKDGWRRLDPKHYAAMDDVSLLKRWVEIDCTGTIKDEVKSKGGIDTLLAKASGKIDENLRKCFANLVFLNDALVGMGVSHTVVTAVVDKASHTYNLKWKMSVDDVAATLPGIAKLCGILSGMNAPAADMAEYLLDDYINTNAEKRPDKIKRFREKSMKYHAVKDVLVSSGISPQDAESGLALFVFKHGSGLERSKFWDNEKTFEKIDCNELEAIVPDCRKMRKILSAIKEAEGKNMTEPLINFMAASVAEREEALLQMEVYIETFLKNRKEQGDFAAALQAREAAEKAAKDRDRKAKVMRDAAENRAGNKVISNAVRRYNAKGPGYNQVHAVVVDFVREVVTEAEDAKTIFTDGTLDEEIREECKRRRVGLEPCSMMDRTFSRETFMEEMTNGLAVAQFGLERLRQMDKTKLCFSGTLFRYGKMSENVRLKGIEFADELAERILDLQKRNVVDSLDDEELKQKFLRVQWRIARSARMRSEQELQQGLAEQAWRSHEIAEKLDECNSALKKIEDATLGTAKIRITPRELLRMELHRADFEHAQMSARTILETTPNDVEANFAMGMWYLRYKRWKDAEKHLLRCKEGKPNETAIWNNLAVIYLKMGKLEMAMNHAKQALSLSPNIPEVRKTLEEIEKAMAKPKIPGEGNYTFTANDP